jgi:SsrA-binding protein
VSGQLFLLGSFIPAFQEKNTKDYDAYRSRKLLASKKEIQEIEMLHHGKSLFIFPISIFDAHGLLKLECGVGKRLKKQDKREVIRKKDDKRKDL